MIPSIRKELISSQSFFTSAYQSSCKLGSKCIFFALEILNQGRVLANRLCGDKSLRIRRIVEEAKLRNGVYFKLLKDCPEVIGTLADWEYHDWRDYDHSLTTARLIQGFNQMCNDNQLPLAVVAFRDSDPIGMISLDLEGEPEFSDLVKQGPWGGSFHVKEEKRKQGVGEALASVIVKIAKALGHKKIHFYTSNPDVVSWYTNRQATIIKNRQPYRHHFVTVMEFNIR